MGVNLAGWMPVRVVTRGATEVVDWAFTQGFDFSDPFFEQTLERALREPFRLLFRRETTFEALEEGIDRARDPDGLVFHLSRCGSTLVASSLRARASTFVLSEPGPLETVVASGWPAEVRVRRLRALMRALAPDRPEPAYVVKLDAWATLDLPLFLAAFPQVPWAFVCRDPREVLVSHQRTRGFHVIPGTLDPRRVGLAPDEVGTLDLDEYASKVLGRILECAADGAVASGSRALLLDFDDLPAPGVERVAEHFGLTLTTADREAARAVASQDAKNPVLPYVDDRAEKRRELTPTAAAAVERFAAAPYARVRELGRR
jgi:hypothetical protein